LWRFGVLVLMSAEPEPYLMSVSLRFCSIRSLDVELRIWCVWYFKETLDEGVRYKIQCLQFLIYIIAHSSPMSKHSIFPNALTSCQSSMLTTVKISQSIETTASWNIGVVPCPCPRLILYDRLRKLPLQYACDSSFSPQ
jgi:hypothetical protein